MKHRATPLAHAVEPLISSLLGLDPSMNQLEKFSQLFGSSKGQLLNVLSLATQAAKKPLRTHVLGETEEDLEEVPIQEEELPQDFMAAAVVKLASIMELLTSPKKKGLK